MSLIKCTECGQMVSDKAQICPSCGCPVSEIIKEINKDILKETNKKSCLLREDDGTISDATYADVFYRILENSKDNWTVLLNYVDGIRKKKNRTERLTNDLYFLIARYLTEDAVKAISSDPEQDFLLLGDYIKSCFYRKDRYGNYKYPPLVLVLYVISKERGIVSLDSYHDIFEQEWIVTHPDIKNISVDQIKEWFPSSQGDDIYSLIVSEEIPKIYNDFYYNEWEYLVSKIFDRQKPKYEDNFGAFDICDLIKKEYDCSDDIYSVVSLVQHFLRFNCGHAKMTHGEICGNVNFDRRSTYYTTWEYVDEFRTDRIGASRIKKYHIRIFESDSQEVLSKMIQYAKEQISQSFELVAAGQWRKDGFMFGDRICFTEEEMRMAKEQHDTEVVELDEMKKRNEEVQRSIRINEQIMASTSVNPVITGQIKGAKCPNCGKESVRKIGNIKRAASIGIFGRFSKDLAKTMECVSCGYKW